MRFLTSDLQVFLAPRLGNSASGILGPSQRPAPGNAEAKKPSPRWRQQCSAVWFAGGML